MGLLAKIETGTTNEPPRILVFSEHGVGKALANSAKVLTPRGFILMRDVRVGMAVIGSDGKPCQVIGVYPQGLKAMYRVGFRDGSSTRCCDNHLWFTSTFQEIRSGYPGSVKSLNYIRNSLKRRTWFNHTVPRIKPVEFSGAGVMPLDPWLLGVYLGDGDSAGSVHITKPERDIQRRVIESLPGGDTATIKDRGKIAIKTARHCHSHSRTRIILLELGLAGLKSHQRFVPDIYLTASICDRLAILRGLCDTDGYALKSDGIEHLSTSWRLASDVAWLVRSLGGSATTKYKAKCWYLKNGVRHSCKPAWRTTITMPEGMPPVSSEKHLAKWKGGEHVRSRHSIRTVEPDGFEESTCIRVDAADSQFVTDDFLVTHNSTYAARCPSPIFIQCEDGLGTIDCKRFPLAKSVRDVTEALDALILEKHEYKTVVIDSVDFLERLIFKAVCDQFACESIDQADGGFGRGHTHALNHWQGILNQLTVLRLDRRMMPLLLAHSKIERYEDPEAESYDRHAPRLHKHGSALLCQWVDMIGYASKRVVMREEKQGFGAKRNRPSLVGSNGGERLLRCWGGPSAVSKNRYGINEDLEFTWPAVAAAIFGSNGE